MLFIKQNVIIFICSLVSLWKEEASKLFPLRDTKAEQFLKETLKTGEIVPSAETPNCENFHYAHVLLDWVKHWDKQTQDRILLEKLIHSKSRGKAECQ